MASTQGACTVVMDLDEFEERFLPTSSTRATRTQDLTTGFVSNIQTLLSGNGESRMDIKEDIGSIVLTAINDHNIADGYRARGYHYASGTRNSANDAAIALLYLEEHTPSTRTKCEDWSRVQMIIQFESGGAPYDPYDDEHFWNPEDSELEQQARAAARDHLIACASSTFKYQHRVFLLSVYINDRHLRVMRLDHSGVIVTRPVDYIKDPALLPRLLWRFAHLTDAQKGLDTTATRLDERSEDYRLMSELGKDNEELDIDYEEGAALPPFASATANTNFSRAAPHSRHSASSTSHATDDPRVFKHIRKAFRKSLGRNWPRYRLKVGEEGREFLVATPVVVSDTSLFGRGCRAYVAVDCSTRQFVWLKDSWRPRSECSRPEGAVLAAFAGDPKLHVPTLVCHGYVRQESTTAPEFSVPATNNRDNAQTRPEVLGEAHVIGMKRSREDECEEVEELQQSPKKRTRRETRSLPAYNHYRLVVKEVCLGLEHFSCGWQLVRLIFECIRTHSRAYKEYGLLHGDISPGNILIHPTIAWKDGREVVVWRGMLIDWELAYCVRVDRPMKPSGGEGPILSWEYASIERISNPRGAGTVEDELEAFFYVLLWYAIRYMRHTLPRPSVAPFVTEFFDTFKRYPNGQISCSDLKRDTVVNARLHYRDSTEVLFCDDGGAPAHPLNGLLSELLRRYQARYAVMQWNRHGDPGAAHQHYPSKLFAAATTTAGRPVLRETQNLASRSRSAQTTLCVQAPSARTRDLARSLQSHKGVVALFSEWVLKGWPLHDKVGDRLSRSYVYTRRFVDVPAVASGATMGPAEDMQRKRAKMLGNGEPTVISG